MRRLTLIAPLIALLLSPAAQAYVGPGLGLGVIAVLVGIVLTVLIALMAIFWYPLKRFVRRLRGDDGKRGGAEDGDG